MKVAAATLVSANLQMMVATTVSESVEFWKNRADEVRTIADGMKVEESRRMMADIAADYEQTFMRRWTIRQL
jgi:hypothetical protein